MRQYGRLSGPMAILATAWLLVFLSQHESSIKVNNCTIIHSVLSCLEHARLMERLTLDKDDQLRLRTEQTDREIEKRIQLLQQQHSDAINSINEGILS